MGYSLDDRFIDDRLAQLHLEQKVLILTGRNFWTTWPVEGIGLRSMVLSDGPSGVRGQRWDERDPSLNLPSASCLSSSWDPEMARRYGNVVAVEARRKGVDVVLGPTVNLHRSPRGGRHFEAYSEDPHLTAVLGAAFVAGLQENGVGATPKHYVANDSETDRFTVDVSVSERALREVYLAAFEPAVTEAGAWTIMSAYNSVNGTTATEHPLLEAPLATEWGFDGVVISDWHAVRSLEAARAAQDLAMPGPASPWGEALVAAVRRGEIDEAFIDRKVRRLLLLAARVGALDGIPAEVPEPVRIEDGVALAHQAAVDGTVLVQNRGLLPLDPARSTRVAVLGQNAELARTQGGGSATVLPEAVVSPLEGLRAALGPDRVDYRLGAVAQEGVTDLPIDQISNPVSGQPGARLRFLDADGSEIAAEDRLSTALLLGGGPAARAVSVQLATIWTPPRSGPVGLGLAAVGTARIAADGRELARLTTEMAPGGDPAASFLAPPWASTPIEVAAGVPVEIEVTLELADRDPGARTVFALHVGIEPRDDEEALLAEAAAVAEAADVAVVVVGTNSRVESEGHDRADLGLPRRQDDLVAAVAATGTPTVVVVNSGAPVEMPWRDRVDAIVVSWFGGQQMGQALADVLTGAAEPGGRLPTTWPAELADAPVSEVTPVDGGLRYDEGVHLGYRAWLRAGAEPAFPFGHGLGYTTWELGDLAVAAGPGPDGHGAGAEVEVTVTNTGDRAGKQVVQAYLSRPASAVDRPVRWLAGHTVVRLDPGRSERVAIGLPARAFAHWDDGWRQEPGVYHVAVGTSVVELPLTAPIELPG